MTSTQQYKRTPPPLPGPSFWHDEKRFKGTGEDSLVQRALLAAGGRRVGGNVKHDPQPGPLGWQRMAAWDVLWSPSATALKVGERGGYNAPYLCCIAGEGCPWKQWVGGCERRRTQRDVLCCEPICHRTQSGCASRVCVGVDVVGRWVREEGDGGIGRASMGAHVQWRSPKVMPSMDGFTS